MFEKFESWAFVAPGAADAFQASWNYWGARGYRVMSTGPASFQGRSFYSRLGLYRVVDITVSPSGTGCVVQFRYRADVSEAGAVGGVALAVLLLPVAVVGGAVSWHEYETDFQNERWAYWNFLTTQGHSTPAAGTNAPAPSASAQAPPPAPPVGTATPPPPPSGAATAAPAAAAAAATATAPAPAPSSCPSCGKPLTGEGKFCASCGTKIG